jgi:hypothetical protein
MLGCTPEARLVCVGQQIYADYRASVVNKLLALQTLQSLGGEGAAEVFRLVLWGDTDRSGSDDLMTQIRWLLPGGQQKTIRLVPRASKDIELRFVPLDEAVLNEALDKLEMFLAQTVHGKKWIDRARARCRELRAAAQTEDVRTLSDFNRRFAQFLFARQLQFDPPSVLDSDILRQGMLAEAVDACLNALDRFITVFNESVNSLTAMGINPQVGPLTDDYLPLYYSCDADARRLRLRHTLAGGDHFATARCTCGAEYRFALGTGSGKLSVAELARTNRWSPDMSVSLLQNDLVSGVVAGKSSALYGIVLNEVLVRVLGKEPVPVLVPVELATAGGGGGEAEPPDSLLYRYLTT